MSIFGWYNMPSNLHGLSHLILVTVPGDATTVSSAVQMKAWAAQLARTHRSQCTLRAADLSPQP